MTEPDLTAGWRPIGDMLAEPRPVDPQPEPAADKKIQRLQARAAEKRTDRHDAIDTWAEKRQAIRDERRAARAERREQRAEKIADRSDRANRIKRASARLAEQFLVTAPILAPMAVAWTGQSQFAMRVLGWLFVASVLYAAAYELTTVYCAWLYHQARSDGDSGWEYRLGTWIFATGAAVQQWWHYSNHWHPTPRAVTYSVMSIVGVLLWEGRARLIHRRKLRAEGKLPPARPRIGMARWTRYPRHSWTAWSLITLEGHRTLDAAWNSANLVLAARRELRTERNSVRRTRRKVQGVIAEPPRHLEPGEPANPSTPNRPELEPAPPEPANQQVPEPHQREVREPAHTDKPVPNPDSTAPEPANPEPRTTRTANLTDRASKRTEQVDQVLNLIAELGYDRVTLPVVLKRTSMSKTTAHHRLKEARAKWNQDAA
ncbi:DUF2637 domain-containing protein [Kitasatospora sp. NBC_01302]|uniref:DUF2637 domain-containing protein n=1 Tax=Kitasatospora sp. NBC_01302 TaxID=2903575 RepID=UPI002E0DDE96|nr:DUF2637 domain-containing protein [Kitasatospora sp. NBC_01302]